MNLPVDRPADARYTGAGGELVVELPLAQVDSRSSRIHLSWPGSRSIRCGPRRDALEREIIGKAVDLLSGPGGLASFLRRRVLGARLAGPSLPLDVGWHENVPAGIRNAVRIRDQHCRFPGGCFL